MFDIDLDDDGGNVGSEIAEAVARRHDEERADEFCTSLALSVMPRDVLGVLLAGVQAKSPNSLLAMSVAEECARREGAFEGS